VAEEIGLPYLEMHQDPGCILDHLMDRDRLSGPVRSVSVALLLDRDHWPPAGEASDLIRGKSGLDRQCSAMQQHDRHR
jgi:hypothetical protein